MIRLEHNGIIGDVFDDVSEDDAGIFDEKNCGTGAGGFKPGNTCGRGGASGHLVPTKRSSEGTLTLENGNPLPPHIPKLPPAWTNVRVSLDKGADLLVQGYDSKGRVQSVYSEEHWTKAAAAKFARISELRSKEKEIIKQIQQAKWSEDPKVKESAAVMELIHSTGIRPGSETDTGANVQAYGATTLQGQHVVKEGKEVRLKFVGKKGVSLEIPVQDYSTAQELLKRKSKVGDNGKLFNVNESDVLNFAHSLDGGGFKTKDFRTLLGTKTALKEVAARDKPKTEKEYKRAVKEVAELYRRSSATPLQLHYSHTLIRLCFRSGGFDACRVRFG